MGCPEFEDLLHEGSGGHASHCEKCRALLEALAQVEATLDAAFVGISAPSGLADAVRARVSRELPVRRPPLIPEILDLIGWAAVLALMAVAVPRFLPLIRAILAEFG
jgi:thiol-disulfide isomerase/thioredoxin